MVWQRGRAYSEDLRSRVLGADGSCRAVAERFGVSVSYVVKARQRRDRDGEIAARPQRSHTRRILGELHDAIALRVAQNPDATLNELRSWLHETHGVGASMGLMWNTLARLGLTLKKRPSTRPSRLVPTSPMLAVSGRNSKAR